MVRSVLASTCVAVALLCPGCIFVDSTRVYTTASPVTSDEMTDLISRTRTLRVGMSRDEALAVYPAQYMNLKSSTSDAGHVFEEWQVEAYDDSDDVYFRRYLYMADGRLAAFSDSRIDYREHPEVMSGWAQ